MPKGGVGGRWSRAGHGRIFRRGREVTWEGLDFQGNVGKIIFE